MDKQLENKLSSREVADMMEMRHDRLIRKIDEINTDFRKHKIGVSKYWEESSYKVEGQKREYREFLITKRGCEFLAHKTTGTKGNLFTDKYMDRFAQMEHALQSNIPVGIESAQGLTFLSQNMAVIGQAVQGLNKYVAGLQEYVKDSIQAKDKQIDDMAEMIGLRSRNVKHLIDKLKETIKLKYEMDIVNSSMPIYQKAKNKIFAEFGVYKWEDIPIGKYNQAYAFIETMFE